MTRLGNTTQDFDNVSATRRSVVLTGAAMLAGFGGANAATIDEIKKRGLMNVVTEDDFYPFEFIKNGKPDGFHKDVINELRAYAPFKVQQEVLPWTGLLAAVTAGKYVAAITGAGVTEERLAAFNYAPPIPSSRASRVPPGSPPLRSCATKALLSPRSVSTPTPGSC